MEREGDLAGHLISVNTSQHAAHKALKRQEIIKSPAHGDRPDILTAQAAKAKPDGTRFIPPKIVFYLSPLKY